jgi:ribosomal protein L11 methyltransferase
MAFGTGTHPTTQLCLELIESFIEERGKKKDIPSFFFPLTLIDVGCGSGILSIAALKLGAQAALGVDIDAGSIKNARENADKNGIGGEFILGQGSVAEVLDGKFLLERAPLVVANILAPVIVRLFEAGLAGLVTTGGILILSGILHEQAQSVIEAGQARGLELSERTQMGDWVALAMSRRAE